MSHSKNLIVQTLHVDNVLFHSLVEISGLTFLRVFISSWALPSDDSDSDSSGDFIHQSQWFCIFQIHFAFKLFFFNFKVMIFFFFFSDWNRHIRKFHQTIFLIFFNCQLFQEKICSFNHAAEPSHALLWKWVLFLL